MSRTVDTPIILPRQWAAGGAEVKHTAPGADHGLQVVARAQNTLYDQHRGTLIQDAEWDSEASILGATVGTNLRYKVPLMGHGSLTETANVGAWVRGNGGAGAGTIQFSDGTNTANVAAPVGSAATVFPVSATMSIIDNAESAEVSCTYISGTVGAVYSPWAYYDRARATLPTVAGQYYTGTTFCPLELDLFAAGYPVSSAMGYTMRDNAAELYSRVGAAITSSWGNSPIGGGFSVVFLKPVPENVDTLRLFVDGRYTPSAGGFTVETARETKAGAFGAARAFATAVDLDVSGADIVAVKITNDATSQMYGVSGYWMARSLPA